jgi:hypothetical protein
MRNIAGIACASLSFASFCADGPLSHQAGRFNDEMVMPQSAAYERAPESSRAAI